MSAAWVRLLQGERARGHRAPLASPAARASCAGPAGGSPRAGTMRDDTVVVLRAPSGPARWYPRASRCRCAAWCTGRLPTRPARKGRSPGPDRHDVTSLRLRRPHRRRRIAAGGVDGTRGVGGADGTREQGRRDGRGRRGWRGGRAHAEPPPGRPRPRWPASHRRSHTHAASMPYRPVTGGTPAVEATPVIPRTARPHRLAGRASSSSDIDADATPTATPSAQVAAATA